MAESPSLDLVINAGIVAGTTDRYFITIGAVNAIGIVPSIFVVTRTDPKANKYTYSRVASLQDMGALGASSVTSNLSYRVSTITLETDSLANLKDYRENIPQVVKYLLDATASGLDTIIGVTETLKVEGEKV